MANLNKVMLIGRLTRDPEITEFPNGGRVANVGFAVHLKHFGLPTDFPLFLPVPQEITDMYSARETGPPDEGCQLMPGADLYDSIDPPAPAACPPRRIGGTKIP